MKRSREIREKKTLMNVCSSEDLNVPGPDSFSDVSISEKTLEQGPHVPHNRPSTRHRHFPDAVIMLS